MTQANNLVFARQEGSLAAARELRRLKVDQSRAIDIFNVIVNANIWLLFQPLDHLLGAYLRRNGIGIIVTTRRQRSVQRLTAAHEFGHHVMNHKGSVDDEGDIADFGSARQIEEAAAQSFATDFLMPSALVNALWDQLGVPSIPEPYHVYLLSLYMGTSYQATVHQLRSLSKINQQRTWDLMQITPKEIKHQIGHGEGPTNPWAEIWPLDEKYAGQLIEVGIDDELRLSLRELPSTGYLWIPDSEEIIDLRYQVATPQQPAEADSTQGNLFTDGADEVNTMLEATSLAAPVGHLGLLRSEYEATDTTGLRDGTGVYGNRYLTFRALRRGAFEFRIGKVRPWQTSLPAVQTFSAYVRILDRPTGDADQGYLETAKKRDIAIVEPVI